MNAVPNSVAIGTAPTASHTLKPKSGTQFSSFRVSPLSHTFEHHPLMQIPRLAELAKELYKTKQCRFIVPNSEQGSKFEHNPETPDGSTIEDVFRRIEETGSWVALYNVETDPAYAGFLKEVTDAARELIDREQPGMFKVGGFIFISAPPSVTPFHIDRENNLWLQVRGRKIMNVWDNTDRHVVDASDVEKFMVSGKLDNVRLRDGYRERSHEFDVGPGDGVYFPTTSPHMTRTTTEWVRPGDGVSISIGVVFYTRHTYRVANIHAFNEFARRRFGIQPRFPGNGGFVDRVKFGIGRTYIWLLKKLRGYRPNVGFELPR